MSDTAIVISGLDDVQRSLADLPRDIVRELFPRALKAGGKVIEAALISRTPESGGSTSTKGYGHMKADIATTVQVNPEQLHGSARVGFGVTGYKARFVEYGHREVSKSGKTVGFTPAKPFIRASAVTSEEAAVEAFIESISED
jgi:HK97 gp10 family phage protein